jgi:hypothetical protein
MYALDVSEESPFPPRPGPQRHNLGLRHSPHLRLLAAIEALNRAQNAEERRLAIIALLAAGLGVESDELVSALSVTLVPRIVQAVRAVTGKAVRHG